MPQFTILPINTTKQISSNELSSSLKEISQPPRSTSTRIITKSRGITSVEVVTRTAQIISPGYSSEITEHYPTIDNQSADFQLLTPTNKIVLGVCVISLLSCFAGVMFFYKIRQRLRRREQGDNDTIILPLTPRTPHTPSSEGLRVRIRDDIRRDSSINNN